MNSKLIDENYEKKRFIFTFFSAMGIGLIAHLFGMVNVFQSDDSINVFNGYGGGLVLGRWGLEILGDFFNVIIGNWNLQFLNNIISLIIIAISSYFIIRIFDIKDLRLCALWSGIFISFPFVTSLFFYAFTSVYYAISIFLTVFGVFATNRYKYGSLIAILCSVLGLGIYQAFFPLMVGLYVLIIFSELLKSNLSIKQIFFKGLKYVGILCVSMILYFLVLKIMLSVCHSELGSYKDIDKMGKISLSSIPILIIRSYIQFFKFLLLDTCYNLFFRIAIILLGVAIAIGVIFILKSKKENKIQIFIFTIAILLLTPLSFALVVVMTNDAWLHTLMIYPICLYFLIPVIMLNFIDNTGRFNIILKRSTLILLSFSVISYVYQSNLNYTMAYFSHRQTENYCNSLITQVKLTEGFNTDLEWVFIDELKDPLLKDNYWWKGLDESENSFDDTENKIKAKLLSSEIRPCIGNDISNARLNRIKNNRLINQIIGYDIKFADKETEDYYRKLPEVADMNTYPNYNSIKVIDNAVVIKLSN